MNLGNQLGKRQMSTAEAEFKGDQGNFYFSKNIFKSYVFVYIFYKRTYIQRYNMRLLRKSSIFQISSQCCQQKRFE